MIQASCKCVCTACTALVACAPCITRACHLAGKLAQQLETPAGLWQPDGIDAARERLEALEQAEAQAKARGKKEQEEQKVQETRQGGREQDGSKAGKRKTRATSE